MGQKSCKGGKKKLNKNNIKIEKLACMYTNTDTLTNKLEELQVLIGIHSPKIICITEVKPKNLKNSLNKASLNIPHYEVYLNEKCLEETGRGVAIYIHEDIAMGCTEDIIRKGPESVLLNTKNLDNSITKVGCVYRSPNATQLENEGLNEIFESFENVNDDTLVVHDFNYPNIT